MCLLTYKMEMNEAQNSIVWNQPGGKHQREIMNVSLKKQKLNFLYCPSGYNMFCSCHKWGSNGGILWWQNWRWIEGQMIDEERDDFKRKFCLFCILLILYFFKFTYCSRDILPNVYRRYKFQVKCKKIKLD